MQCGGHCSSSHRPGLGCLALPGNYVNYHKPLNKKHFLSKLVKNVVMVSVA